MGEKALPDSKVRKIADNPKLSKVKLEKEATIDKKKVSTEPPMEPTQCAACKGAHRAHTCEKARSSENKAEKKMTKKEAAASAAEAKKLAAQAKNKAAEAKVAAAAIGAAGDADQEDEEWQSTGHEWIGRKALRTFDGQVLQQPHPLLGWGYSQPPAYKLLMGGALAEEHVEAEHH